MRSLTQPPGTREHSLNHCSDIPYRFRIWHSRCAISECCSSIRVLLPAMVGRSYVRCAKRRTWHASADPGKVRFSRSSHCCRKLTQRRSDPTLANGHLHLAFACPIAFCSFRYENSAGLLHHLNNDHVELRTCHQCGEVFWCREALSGHAASTGHAAYACEEVGCEATCSRYDVYVRHKALHREDVPRFPCPHYKRHRGRDGFKRKDHLTQHLRNYHHIGEEDVVGDSKSCYHEDCSAYREQPRYEGHAFKKSSDYTAHVRKAHDESPYPCTKPGCNRVGGKGYFRERDLMKHQKKGLHRRVSG